MYQRTLTHIDMYYIFEGLMLPAPNYVQKQFFPSDLETGRQRTQGFWPNNSIIVCRETKYGLKALCMKTKNKSLQRQKIEDQEFASKDTHQSLSLDGPSTILLKYGQTLEHYING